MFGVLAEDDSDATTVANLVRRLYARSHDEANVPIKRKGFGGCGKLLSKGERQAIAYRNIGVRWFIVVHDADGEDPNQVSENVLHKVVKPASIAAASCIVVPVQELEAWLIADAQAVRKVIPTIQISDESDPEKLENPKEWLERLSGSARPDRKRRLYVHAVHNEKVANHVDLDVVHKKCPSFRNLKQFVDSR